MGRMLYACTTVAWVGGSRLNFGRPIKFSQVFCQPRPLESPPWRVVQYGPEASRLKMVLKRLSRLVEFGDTFDISMAQKDLPVCM